MNMKTGQRGEQRKRNTPKNRIRNKWGMWIKSWEIKDKSKE